MSNDLIWDNVYMGHNGSTHVKAVSVFHRRSEKMPCRLEALRFQDQADVFIAVWCIKESPEWQIPWEKAFKGPDVRDGIFYKSPFAPPTEKHYKSFYTWGQSKDISRAAVCRVTLVASGEFG